VAEIQFFGNPATTTLTQLTGTVIGTAGSYQNLGTTINNVFDGNLSTYFDAPVGTGAWAGLDLGTAHSISQISFAPRSGFAYRMLGGMFQASDSADFSTGVVNLYTVTTKPPSNALTTVTVNVTGSYRYVRYIGPDNACCNISEAVFYG
jgi:endoglucanase